MSRQLLSVVVPVFNEEAGIEEFYARTVKVLRDLADTEYELIFVNDGSTDASPARLRTISERDERVSLISLSRNFGHQIAITAGIDSAKGDAVVVIDADLQDPPEVIVGMVEKWRQGWDVVYGQRTARPGESRFKLWTAHAFYRVINALSDVELPLDAGDFRLMSRNVVDALKSIREENRYMRGLVSWVGFRQTGLPYERDARYAGETKYSLRKMLAFASDGISSFSERPLRLAMFVGLLVTVAAFVMALFIVAGKIIDPSGQLPGYASMMAVILLLGGVQLMAIGILGQYIGRTYREVKNRPLYLIAEQRPAAQIESESPSISVVLESHRV